MPPPVASLCPPSSHSPNAHTPLQRTLSRPTHLLARRGTSLSRHRWRGNEILSIREAHSFGTELTRRERRVGSDCDRLDRAKLHFCHISASHGRKYYNLA